MNVTKKRAMRMSRSKSWTSGFGLLSFIMLLGFVAQTVSSSRPDEKNLVENSGLKSKEEKQNILLAEHDQHRRIKDAKNKNKKSNEKGRAKKPTEETPADAAKETKGGDLDPDTSTTKRKAVNSTESAGVTEAPVPAVSPTDSPVKASVNDADAPVAAPVSVDTSDTPAPALSSAANGTTAAPTKSPVKETPSPTVSPVVPPAETPAPTKSPLDASPVDPTDSPVETPAADGCELPKNCDSCQQLADSLADGGEKYSCWWSEDKCITVGPSEHQGETMCATKKSEPQGKPTQPSSKPTQQQAAKPTSSPHTSWDGGDGDDESYFTLILGLVGVLGILFILVRKLCSSQIMTVRGGHAQGKYQGVSMSDAEEDDEEWGWDDTPKQGSSVEMSTVRSPPATSNQALHFRNNSPRSSGVGSFDSKPGLSVKAPSQTARKGLSVKRAGMKNPMKQQPAAAPATQRLQPPAPIVRKTAEKIPSTDDFFEEMGFSTPKPKAGAASTTRSVATKGVGATVLSVGAEDLSGGGDEWDDNDLDDLLDD